MSDTNKINLFKKVLKAEADAISAAILKVDLAMIDKLAAILEVGVATDASFFFSGVGKSGFIAQKLASTFSSLGRPAFFLHPVEALHGDFGQVRAHDIVILLSKSGTTEEIIKFMPFLKIKAANIIGLLGNVTSPIAAQCAVVIDCSVEEEACINNLAPTTSSTLTLALGDAMAVMYESIVNLSTEHFAINHPGGILGKSLNFKVAHLMLPLEKCPLITADLKLQDIILAMTKYPLGGCAVVDEENKLLGIIVEGDIRRTFAKNADGLNVVASKIMNTTPITVTPDDMAKTALRLMEERGAGQINILPVVDGSKFVGFLRLHDLLKEGFSIKSS